ncbi:nuclear pore complex protein Nup153 [Coccinella septempunctata]|uniref:nuclear pore complex protein Nup153 n=1 Tax=Coccinella septempunctata TaxID=41139 RepID=UPI001D08FE8E|nr:nuclear pore complex protein Nup153 [Coccinella septempunctata]
METNNSKDDIVNGSTNSKDSEEDESFVTKVRSRVSGLLSSSFSRLFKNQDKRSGVVRSREDEETNEIQPPCKKAKGMENDTLSTTRYRENTISHSEFMANLNNDSSVETTMEPIPGPSFISQRSVQKTFNNSTTTGVSNRDKYVESENTSGYSSMAKLSEKQLGKNNGISESMINPTEKTFSEKKSMFDVSTPITPSRSLFADQSFSPQDKNTSLSSRKPSFNMSNFGSPSFVDRTLTTSKIINSPFYNGSTIYGGASAYGRQLGMNETRKQQLKNSFMVKPVNKSSDSKSFTSLSKTARRILETLEQCSNPMSDVKKVPLPTRTDKQGLFSKYVAANPYSKNSKMGSSKELLVPSVSERLKMKQIQRLQDKTNEIRHIASSSNSNLNNEEYKISTENQQKHTNKMKSKITSVRSKAPTIEVLDDYILNPVPLMIPENKYPTFEMPEFNITASQENKDKNKILEKEKQDGLKNDVAIKKDLKTDMVKLVENGNQAVGIKTSVNKLKPALSELQNKTTDSVTEYTFSKPLVIADNSKSIIAINNFKFSEPLSKKIKLTENASETDQKKSQSKEIETKMTNGNLSCESDNVDLKISSDPLLEKFKPPEGTWECQTCLIRNKSQVTKCAACETPRAEKSQNSKKDSTLSFGLQFAKKLDEWDCPTCSVRNKVQNNICVACATPKVSKPETNGIGNKFKAPSNGWECDTCWVRNKNESQKCVACESTRKDLSSKSSDSMNPCLKVTKCQMCLSEIKGVEGKCTQCENSRTNQIKFDFPSHLKPSNETWECGTCLIRNKNELKACAACETPREQTINEVKTDAPTKKSEKWECPTCMVRNNSEVEKCPCCETPKPGVTLVNKSNVNMFNFGVNKMQFNFGIPKDMQGSSSSAISSTSSLFGNTSNETSSATPVFKFGIAQENTEKNDSKVEQKTFSLSNSTESESKNKADSNSVQSLPNNENKEKSDSFLFKTPSVASDKSSLPVFKFGAPTADSKEPPKDAAAPNLLFKFTPPKPVTVDNKFTGTSLEDPKKTDTASTSLVAPSAPQSDSTKPLFSFGSKDNDSKDKNAKPMFSFGSSSSSSAQPGGFNFNPVKTDVTLQPTNSVSFASNSVQQSTNSEGSTMKNGGFNFGSTTMNSNQAAVFSFGATQNPAEATPLGKGGFDFSSAVKPAGGFNFSAPVPSFDAGTKPSFNFTGGSVPTFSANPTEGGGGPVPVRKFKRAVRRTQR